MRSQQLLACLVLVKQALKNENAEVVPHSENEGGKYDIDNVELHSEHTHHSDNDDPAQQHRQETEKGQFNAAERKPEHEENQEGGNVKNQIEIVIDIFRSPVREIALVEDHNAGIIQCGIDPVNIGDRNIHLGNQHLMRSGLPRPCRDSRRSIIEIIRGGAGLGKFLYSIVESIGPESVAFRSQPRRSLQGILPFRRPPGIPPFNSGIPGRRRDKEKARRIPGQHQAGCLQGIQLPACPRIGFESKRLIRTCTYDHH